jgi:putative ABC transport system ATP-binding protein
MPQKSTTLAVYAENLRFRWQKELPYTLDIPKLEVKRGENLFIRGASGSGKSTLLALLAGVNTPTEGKVVALNQALNRLSGLQRDRFRADHVGYLFQLFNLIPYLSVLDNVILPCRFSRLRKQRATALGNSLVDEARRLLDHLDIGSDALLHRPVTSLSVGQQQRVAAARALIGSPEIIIADEPTSALDSDNRQAFIRLLFQECETAHSTLIFVSHDPHLETLFKRHITLSELNAVSQKDR